MRSRHRSREESDDRTREVGPVDRSRATGRAAASSRLAQLAARRGSRRLRADPVLAAGRTERVGAQLHRLPLARGSRRGRDGRDRSRRRRLRDARERWGLRDPDPDRPPGPRPRGGATSERGRDHRRGRARGHRPQRHPQLPALPAVDRGVAVHRQARSAPARGRDRGDHRVAREGLRRRGPIDPIQRRGRLRGREAGDQRGRRLPEEPPALREGRRDGSARRADGGAAGDRQDAPRASRCRRGRGPVPRDHRLGLRRAVRRCRGLARSRPVHRREEAGTRDRLHRRDRRDRPAARRGVLDERRTRADAEPAARGDGRVRSFDRRGGARGDEPPRGPRPGAPAPRAVRPPRRDPLAEPEGTSRDPHGPREGQALRGRRGLRCGSTEHAGVLRRRSRESGERGGHLRRACRARDDHRRGLLGSARPHPARPPRGFERAAPRGEARGRRPRGRPRRRGGALGERRPGREGHDPATGPGPRGHRAAPGGRAADLSGELPARLAHDPPRRARGRAARAQRDLVGCVERSRRRHAARDEDGAGVRDEPPPRAGRLLRGRSAVPRRSAAHDPAVRGGDAARDRRGGLSAAEGRRRSRRCAPRVTP